MYGAIMARNTRMHSANSKSWAVVPIFFVLCGFGINVLGILFAPPGFLWVFFAFGGLFCIFGFFCALYNYRVFAQWP